MTLERIERILNTSDAKINNEHSRIFAEMRQALGAFDIPLPSTENVRGLRFIRQELEKRGLFPLVAVVDEVLTQRNGRDLNLNSGEIESSRGKGRDLGNQTAETSRKPKVLTQEFADRFRPIADTISDSTNVFHLLASSSQQLPQIAKFRRRINISESRALGLAFSNTFWLFRKFRGEDFKSGEKVSVLVSDYRNLDYHFEERHIPLTSSTLFVAEVFRPQPNQTIN